jgi:hypothetical protein
MLAFLLSCTAFATEEAPGPPLKFTNYVSLTPFDQAVVADYNADGLVDIFAASRATFHWNNGTNFSPAGPHEGSTFGLGPVAADFDGDNAIDIYTGWPAFRSGTVISNHFTIWWNGTGRNTNPPSPFVPTLLGNSAAADFDNDGDLDLMITGSTNREPFAFVGGGLARLYENLGSREFVPHLASFPRFERGVVSWADYDSDGDMDLLLSGMTNQNSAATILYRNDDGVFTNSGAQFPRIAEGSASWADYDGDNDLDLLLTGRTNDIRYDWPHAAIYRNEAGAFTPVSFGATNISRIVLSAWADFDVDGDLDIVACAPYTQSIRFFLNNGNDTFVASTHSAQGGYMIPADLNNDGLLDLVSHNLDWPIYTVLNLFWRSNTPPSAPTNLIATPSNGTATFTWNSSTDAEQPTGLTYNLRIGTAPGKADIMSAMANPTNGVRYVPRPGNTGLRTNWTIKNFAVGTYYWSVQAIDLGLKSSVFADEQTFTITNAPPFGRTLSFANITPQGALVEVRLNPNGAPTSFYLEYISPNGTDTTDVRQFEAGTSNLFSKILLSGLEPSTSYQVWLVISNSFGVLRSGPTFFTTAPTTILTEFPAPFPVLARNTSFFPIDLDQDGDLDLINSGAFSNTLMTTKVFLNELGLFHEAPPIPNPDFLPGGWLAASADFNNDAQLDLIMTDGTYLGMLLQTTNRTFEARRMSEIISPTPSKLFIGDAENDGDLDIVGSFSFPLHTIGVYANDNIPRLRGTALRFGGGQFAEWGDYDADGDNDLLVAGSTNDFQGDPRYAVTRIFRSDAANVFSDLQANLPGAFPGASWSDYDNDGDLDVLLVHVTNFLSSTTNHLRLFRNDATNGFNEVGTILAEPSLFYPQWLDFNRDGRNDIFVFQHFDRAADRLRLFLNIGDDQFTELNLGLPAITNLQAKFADIDADLMPDLLVSAMATNQSQRVRIFRNNLTSTNPAPPIPTSLTSVVARTSATLHWQIPQPIDDTNTIAHTFNLRIGTTPGGSEIMSPMSHPLTGARYLPQRGNAGQTGTWLIRDLPPGTYHWSVQSVDHAFNASPFSSEATFTIAPYERTPQILAVTLRTNGLPQLTIDGPTRSRAQIYTSFDLLNWTPATGYTYIGGDPATYPAPNNDTRFYRFQLLE